jgi:GST-like protein
MAGQAHHFLRYAPSLDPPQALPYAQNRYRNEVARLYGVLDRRLDGRPFVAGDFLSIADMAIWPWAMGWQGQEQTLDDKPNLARWLDQLAQRPAFQKGRAAGADRRSDLTTDRRAQDVLFGKQKA